jgi:hypothetical protein
MDDFSGIDRTTTDPKPMEGVALTEEHIRQGAELVKEKFKRPWVDFMSPDEYEATLVASIGCLSPPKEEYIVPNYDGGFITKDPVTLTTNGTLALSLRQFHEFWYFYNIAPSDIRDLWGFFPNDKLLDALFEAAKRIYSLFELQERPKLEIVQGGRELRISIPTSLGDLEATALLDRFDEWYLELPVDIRCIFVVDVSFRE